MLHCVLNSKEKGREIKMGVSASFVKQRKLYQNLNIIDEIQEIIFDVMGFIHNFGKNVNELNMDGRQHIYLPKFELFLIELRESGATLAFFCDGKLQSDRNNVWCKRCDAEFDASRPYTNLSNGMTIFFRC